MSSGVITVGVGLLGGFIALMVQSMVVVPHSRVVVIERFGKYHRTLVPGLHRRWPIIERRRALVDLSPRVVDLTEPIVFVDHTVVPVRARVTVQTEDPVAAVYATSDQTAAISKAAVFVLRAVLGMLTVEEVARGVSRTSRQLRAQLEDTVSRFGASVLEFEILDPAPRPAALEDRLPQDLPTPNPRPGAAHPAPVTHHGVWDAPDALSM